MLPRDLTIITGHFQLWLFIFYCNYCSVTSINSFDSTKTFTWIHSQGPRSTCNFLHKIETVKLGNMVRFRALLCLGVPTQCQRLQFYRGPWCQRFYRDFMLKTGWHWKLGARATGVFRSAVKENWLGESDFIEGQLTPQPKKGFTRVTWCQLFYRKWCS